MRKVIISFCLILFTVVVSAQLTVTGTHLKFKKVIGKDTVTVIVFDSINSTTEINYSGKDVKFYKYADALADSKYATTLFPPDNATGYIIKDDGKRVDSIFVLSYSNYRPVFTSFSAENDPTNQCSNVNLLLTAKIPALKYQTPNGKSDSLKREFSIKYNSLKFVEKWITNDTTEINNLPSTSLVSHKISVKSPLCDTYFTLSGDQYGAQLEKFDSIKSPLYSAVAVKCYPTFIVEKREEKNETERPFTNTQEKYSAPLSCQFLSNANEPVTKYYKWEIFKDKDIHPIITRTDKDHRYTFAEAGDYEVKIIASNAALCSDSSTLSITISESSLLVPNVFTPNGDGQNDEFRVAYKSIISFEAWVYNRWGRKVFYWNDPQKGWDGNINGKKAVPGPYFYVMKATGSDGVKYLKKGDINLLRGVEK